MKIFIVIPAYNEDQALNQVLADLKKNYNNIIVVDDGSKDNTYQQALAANVRVLIHQLNRGQGAALVTGITYALKNHADIIVTFDADGQHNTGDIKNLIEPIINKEVEVVLGSRFLQKPNNIPRFRKLLLKMGILFTWLTSGVKLTDVHNGLRAFSKTAASLIILKQDRMAHSTEIIDEIRRNHLTFKEVPVTINYTKYSLAKGQKALDSLRIAKEIIIRKIIK